MRTRTNLDALTSAIGEALNVFGGVRITRLTGTVAVGSTSVVVEHSFDWPTSGRVCIDGVTYHYTGNDLPSGTLSGLYVLVGGAQVPGTQVPHAENASVFDASQTFSGIDQIRQAMLVDFATGDDLSALGRNVGVLRNPFLRSDDQFRAIIKALAYNPKGTVYGLTQALDAMLGVGNYKLSEDPVNMPCVVTVSVPTGLFLDSVPQGRGIVTGPFQVKAASAALPPYTLLSGQTLYRMGNLLLSPETVVTDCRTALPSADTQGVVPTLAGQVWLYVGSPSESSAWQVVPAGSKLVAPGGSVAYYSHTALQCVPASSVHFAAVLQLTTPSSFPTSLSRLMVLQDGSRNLSLAFQNVGGVLYAGFTNDGTTFVGGSFVVPRDTFSSTVEVCIRKRGTQYVELYFNGALVKQYPYSTFTSATTAVAAQVGNIFGVTPLPSFIVRLLSITSRTSTDYWSATAADASVATGSQNVTLGSLTLQAADVGKQLRVSGSQVANAQGGNNNCVVWVQPGSTGSTVVADGSTQTNAQVDTANNVRITMPSQAMAFTYPDDLGKKITITGSALGNNGTYTIVRLLDPVSLVNLASYKTSLAGVTNVCEVVNTTGFVSETGLSWKMTPTFTTESGLTWELSDAGSTSTTAGVVTITPRQTLPVASGVYDERADNVLSAQILGASTVQNALTSVGPPAQFTVWPLYVADPTNVVRAYLDQITAAGVAVQFNFI